MMPKLPPQFLQMIRGGNPQQILSGMIQQNNNPMLQNVMNMMNNGDSSGIEQFARNLCASKGIDADELMRNVQEQFK